MLATLVVTACAQKKGTEETSSSQSLTDVESTSSTVRDDAKEVAKWVADSLEKATFQTPDLTFYNLRGPVKAMHRNDHTIYFSEDGVLTRIDDYNPFEGSAYDGGSYNPQSYLTRDSEGRISAEEGWEWVTEYTWKDGHVVAEEGQAESSFWKYKYTLDEHGDVVRMAGTEGDLADETEEPALHQWKYTKRDRYDNWVKAEQLNADGEKLVDEERSIYYYPLERRPSKTTFNIDPAERNYILKGKLGGDKDAVMCIAQKDGYYKIKSGKRLLRFGFYDAETGDMELYAYLPGQQLKVGIFFGRVKDGVYKGVFLNVQSYGKVDFELRIED